MKNHIWVVEARFGQKWHPLKGEETRRIARWSQKHTYAGFETRIRKYVPA